MKALHKIYGIGDIMVSDKEPFSFMFKNDCGTIYFSLANEFHIKGTLSVVFDLEASYLREVKAQHDASIIANGRLKPFKK